MHTLQEFTTQAKGMGYITAGVVLMTYILFWFVLVGLDRKKK